MVRRIIELRKKNGLNQEQFAERLNLSRSFVNQVEVGKRNISDRTFADICRIFNVSERWLRTGEGEMFKKIGEAEELEQILAAISVSKDETIKKIIRAYWKLTDSEKAGVRELIDRLVDESGQTTEPPAAPQNQLTELVGKPAEAELAAVIPEGSTPEIEAQVARIREQLILEASTRTSEASTQARAG